MSIKTKFILVAVVSLTAAMATGFILFQNASTVARELEKQGVISEIENKIFERTILRDDYLLYREERPIIQLQKVSKDLDRLIVQARLMLISSDEKTSIDLLASNKNFIDSALSQIIAQPSLELQQQLISQILVRSQDNITIASQLEDASRKSVIGSQQRTIFFVLILIAGISLIIIIAFYFIWRALGEPLIALKEAAVRIASLDFTTTTTTTTTTTVHAHDEIGQLAKVFDSMVDNLRESYQETRDRTQRLEEANKAVQNILEDFEEKQKALAEANAKDEAILGSIADGCIAVNKKGDIVVMNRMAQKILGFTSKESLGKPWHEILRRENEAGKLMRPEEGAIHAALFTTTTMTTTTEDKKERTASPIRTSPEAYYYVRKNKTRFPVAITVSPVLLKNKIIGAIEVFRDVTKEKEVDKAKSEFVSLASHQLRTPLSAINWYAEMLLAGDAGKLKAEQKKYVEEVYRGSQRMAELVGALLNVSRLELGTFVIDPMPTDIPALVQDEIDQQKRQTDAKRIALSFSYEKDIPVIPADSKLLRIVVQNLLSNATKYTPEGGKIAISLSLDDMQNLLLAISDTGFGIPKGQQDQIFTKLFRADNVREKDTEGTGLGLYIVKSILDHSGGKIWFESEENKGSIFSVTIPREGMKKREGTKALG